MSRRRLVFDGKVKTLYEGPEPGTLIQHFKDEAGHDTADTSAEGAKSAQVEGKGALNNRITEYLFQRLGDIGVPTHFIRRVNMREQLIREVELIPLEVVVRNVAAGDFAKRLGLTEGMQLPRSIVEFHFKSEPLSNPLVTEEHILAFGWAAPTEIDELLALALRINDFMTGLFLGIGIKLIEFHIEFGRLWENDMMRIVLADEISPDNCKLWDAKTGEPLDKEALKGNSTALVEAYQDIARRLGVLTEAPKAKTRGPVLVTSNDKLN